MAAIAAREDEIERSLAGFLRARAEQEEVMDAARARCEAILLRASERLEGARVQADVHVVRLLELVGDRDEVATRTGLSQRELRRAMRAAATGATEEDAVAVGAGGGAGGAGQGGIQPRGSAAPPSVPGSVVTAPATIGRSDDGGVEESAGGSPVHGG